MSHCYLHVGNATRNLWRCFPVGERGRCKTTQKNIADYTDISVRIGKGEHTRAKAARRCYNHQNVTQCGPELKPYISRLNTYPDISDMKDCINQVEKQCKQKRITAAKVLRATMQSVETIIRAIPDVYIIYYVRDPRGICNSRSSGFKHVKAVCSQMRGNHQIYVQLKQKYPGVIHFMKYEDLAINTKQTVSDIFAFLNESIPREVEEKLTQQTNNSEVQETKGGAYRQNSTLTATEWRNIIKQSDHDMALAECRDVLKMLNYDV